MGVLAAESKKLDYLHKNPVTFHLPGISRRIRLETG